MSPHYANAPITEAIIDIRATLPESATRESIAAANICAGDTFTPGVEQHANLAQFNVGPEPTASATAEFYGYRYDSRDGKLALQVQQTGLTLSRLAPYDSWEPFCQEAKKFWSLYRKQLAPKTVDRLAVRYINRIDIPSPVGDLKDYLLICPEVTHDLENAFVASFFLQVALPQPDIRATALVNETRVPPAKAELVSIVLDIDVFRDTDVPQGEAEIWSFFEELHLRKNRIFEATITDKVRKLIE